MSINLIAKSLAKELMSTREYQMMNQKKKLLYSHPKWGGQAKNYEAKQLTIMRTNVSAEKRKSMISNLTKEYQLLMATKEMKDYVESITAFQKRSYAIFQSLNSEINKIVNQ